MVVWAPDGLHRITCRSTEISAPTERKPTHVGLTPYGPPREGSESHSGSGFCLRGPSDLGSRRFSSVKVFEKRNAGPLSYSKGEGLRIALRGWSCGLLRCSAERRSGQTGHVGWAGGFVNQRHACSFSKKQKSPSPKRRLIPIYKGQLLRTPRVAIGAIIRPGRWSMH